MRQIPTFTIRRHFRNWWLLERMPDGSYDLVASFTYRRGALAVAARLGGAVVGAA